MSYNDFKELYRICQKIGITTMGELDYFDKHEHDRGQTTLQRLQNYEIEFDSHT